MHTLFNIDLNIQAGVVREPSWIYIRESARRDLKEFIQYYQNTANTVPANHLLVRLLQSITVPRALEVNRYYDLVESMSSNLSMALNFTSSIAKGKIFNNVFYGVNSSEVIISQASSFNPEFVHKNWKNISSVNVIRHDRTNSAMNPLKGDDGYSRKELAVIVIDIPMLAVQYRAFRENESLTSPDDSQRSAMQFIAMYVLPAMMQSHLDHVIFNRAFSILTNRPIERFDSKTPFYQTNLSDKIDKSLTEVIKLFVTRKARFETILKSLQVVSYPSLFELMTLPKVLPTRQVTWALVASRIRVLKFLFLINHLSGANENQSNMNRILRHAIFYRSDNTLSYGLTPDLFLDIQETIDDLVDLAKQ